MKHFAQIMSVIYTAGMVALAAGSVGKMLPAAKADWGLPISMFGSIFMAWLLGYLSAKDY